ncbi:unnamed protein product, partial [Rotaria sordida]
DVESYYVFNTFLYIGRQSDHERQQHVRANVVLELLKSLYGSKGNITIDNFFTSVSLAKELQKKNFTLIGTLRKNKPEIPMEFQSNKIAKLLRRLEEVQAIPFLLIDEAYLWYVEHIDLIISFELFSKLFRQQYSSTSSTKQNNTSVETVAPSITAPSFLSISSHLQQTIADEIIKKPTYFRGSKDDVHD